MRGGSDIFGSSQGVQPLEQRPVFLPGRDIRECGRVGDLLKGFAFHLEVGPRVELRRRHALMAKEVADNLQRDSGLEQVHALCVPEGVRADRLREAGVGDSCGLNVLVQDIADSPSCQLLALPVLE